MPVDLGLRAGWMVAVVPAGVLVVGPRVEIEIAVDAREAGALVASLAAPSDPDDRLVALLEEHGALGAPAGVPSPAGVPLAEAIRRARRGEAPGSPICTAEEALVLPPDLDRRTRTRAVRAFVAGLRPDGRLQAYALVARGEGGIVGDLPDPELLRRRLAERSPTADTIAVVDLTSGRRPVEVGREGLDRLGAAVPHRLGPILRETVRAPAGDGEEWLCVAEIAVGNLAAVGPPHERLVQGVGEDEAHARLVAHAEGAERFAAAEPSGAEIVRAARAERPGAVDPAALYASGRDEDVDDVAAREAPRLWAPATDREGTRRWVPAETVYTSVVAPAPAAAILPWTSSGLAAHTDPVAARQRAFCELVERDAFMWTWIQRVSRERVSPRGVPEPARVLAARVRAAGWTTHWVNLSLETVPVLLCCLTHERRGLTIGAAADTDPAVALGRATAEAAMLALYLDDGAADRPTPRGVRGPRDHVLLHRDPARVAEHGFLYAADDELDLGDIPGGAAGGGDLEDRLYALGFSPLVADLTIPACRPFHVVRALAPGLLPLTFGFGTEPLGLPRARRPVRTRDGRRIGTRLRPDQLGTMHPHPFP